MRLYLYINPRLLTVEELIVKLQYLTSTHNITSELKNYLSSLKFEIKPKLYQRWNKI